MVTAAVWRFCFSKLWLRLTCSGSLHSGGRTQPRTFEHPRRTGKAFCAEGFEELRLRKGALRLGAAERTHYLFCACRAAPTMGVQSVWRHGIEIPALRDWLNEHKPGEQSGIFRSGFVGYYTANEDVFRDFKVDHGCRSERPLGWAYKGSAQSDSANLDHLIATTGRTGTHLDGWRTRAIKPRGTFSFSGCTTPTLAS